MKRVLSLVLPLILTICLGALAQTDTTPSPSSTNQATSPRSSSSTQSNDQTTSPAQANPGSSSTMAQSGTTASSCRSVEGCIVQRQADYYLQPETGQAIKLNSSQDLSQHLGHRVRVEGNMNQACSSGSPGSGTYGSGAALELYFYRVDQFENEIENRIFREVRWVERKELPTYDFLEADVRLVKDISLGKLL